MLKVLVLKSASPFLGFEKVLCCGLKEVSTIYIVALYKISLKDAFPVLFC